MADAEQRHDVAVAARLRQQALARIDQHHGDVGGGRAGGHVARVLLVARAVGDDELALVGAEEAVGDIDGDALLALGGEAVEQQRVIDVVALRCHGDGCRCPARPAGRRTARLLSYSRRPISVLLPSSTLPQVMKRSRPLVSCCCR